MMFKRLFLLLLAGMLALSIVGCGSQKDAASEASKSSATEASKGPAKEISIEIYTTPAGTDTNVLNNAFANLLKKEHPWLKGNIVETTGTVDMIKTTEKFDANRRKNVIFSTAQPDVARAFAGLAPYERKYNKDLKILAVEQFKTFNFVTFDPKIKTMKDLTDKKLVLWPKGSGSYYISLFLLNDSYKMADQVKSINAQPAQMGEYLMTGAADAAFLGATYNPVSGKFSISGSLMELMSKKPTYWVDIDKAAVEAGLKKASLDMPGYAWSTIPAGAFGNNKPDKDVGTLTWHVVLYSWADMDDNVAYEIVKSLDEMGSAGKFSEFIPEYKLGIGGKSLVDLPGLREDLVHPGALKYYKEKGYL